MWTEPGVTRFIGGKARTREESWIRFLRHAGMWAMTGFGLWAIEEKETGRFIGEAGFHDLKRNMKPSIEGLPEAGWSLVTDAQGRGFGTEVVSAVVTLGEALSGMRQVCIIDPVNHASIAVARKCGFRNPRRRRVRRRKNPALGAVIADCRHARHKIRRMGIKNRGRRSDSKFLAQHLCSNHLKSLPISV